MKQPNALKESSPAFRLIPILRVVVDSKMKVGDKCIETPGAAYGILRSFIGNTDREKLVVMTLNTKNEATSLNLVSMGDLNSSIVRPADVFKVATFNNAASVIIAHNHPSGSTTPSPEDWAVTRRLQEAGEIMGITVLDHIIIGDNGYTSLKADATFDLNHQSAIRYDNFTLTTPKLSRASALYPHT